ncbi:4Fe-4S dicluster domain-containing protein [Novosphingobium mangrovi (ex Huang et al. 2023)]|uniref:4Fe-4S dicluster domain-containing protein n=1 Tax=Novosphingobium mangrovi (ex Huang et al. 2023) TaxID=2976432 RepID=A0ABT2I0L5_9SPHN|nr:4Fe-4S dicluster domain-containing protein [Novosphingobium mangrovi (ex Huang et al. 2023)]MCT2398343.1 4Fe-4S dicluster domain-containing protein [Novosphingobium mangrovi (ex Huang et al. 2023)]
MQRDSADTAGLVIDPLGLQALIERLASMGFRVVGPALRDDAVVYDDITGIGDLPQGWTDRQEPGRYRLERRQDDALFGYAVGPHSWKKFLFPPVETLWSARWDDKGGMAISPPETSQDKFAFIGVRGCELHAMAIQDRVLAEGDHANATYAARRQEAFIVAVNCGQAGGTCFCVSMETGPKVESGFDLALTELLDGGEHRFLVEIGSDAGAQVMEEVPSAPASAVQIEAAAAVVERTAGQMGRSLDTNGIKELLQGNLEHPRWDEVAERCLTCANCTMVCPTCFCTTVEDHSDLTNQSAERVRKWDSCFTMDFSYVHGGSVRSSTRSRYRQWMTHKLANWIDQFGTSGCVGCGRCVTWCPVGIDITEEAAAIRATPGGKGEA